MSNEEQLAANNGFGQPRNNEGPFRLDRTKPELREAAWRDYMTGHYTAAQLAAKHNLKISSVIYYIRTFWKQQALATGVTLVPDPDINRAATHGAPPEVWDAAEKDFRAGVSCSRIAAKYDIEYQTVLKRRAKFGWVKLFDPKRPHIDPRVMATVPERLMEFDEIALGFIVAASQKIKDMTLALLEQNEMSTDDLERQIKTFEKLKKLLEPIRQSVEAVFESRRAMEKESAKKQVNKPSNATHPALEAPAKLLKVAS